MKFESSLVLIFVGLMLFLTTTKAVSTTADTYAVDVKKLKSNLISYAGFLEADNDFQVFFWFFPSESKRETDPVIVWLQDVGTSSLKGLYENNGPFYVKINKGTNSRKSYWSQTNNVLYLDTAVGTGYSNFNRTDQVPATMNELIFNLYNNLDKFFKVFNSYKNNDLYLAGEGFACQILTKLAKKIDQNRSMRLKGIIIENGFCDPLSTIPIANHLFSLRMIDVFGQTRMVQAERHILESIHNNKYTNAFDNYDTYIKGLLTPYNTLFTNYTHYKSSHNILHDSDYRIQGNFSNYVMKEGVKKSLNVPIESTYYNGKNALRSVRGELMYSSLEDLGKLMDKYKVLMYYGQMNPEITPKGAFLTGSSIKWCGKTFFGDEYTPWFVDNTMAGYIAKVITESCKGSFTWALVRNAGKDIAGEKSKEISDLIHKFITEKS